MEGLSPQQEQQLSSPTNVQQITLQPAMRHKAGNFARISLSYGPDMLCGRMTSANTAKNGKQPQTGRAFCQSRHNADRQHPSRLSVCKQHLLQGNPGTRKTILEMQISPETPFRVFQAIDAGP
jgi:hypothetical protein